MLAEESECWLCGGPFPDVQWFHRLYPTLDHVVPLAKGGAAMDRSNARAAHFHCNTERGSRESFRVKDFV